MLTTKEQRQARARAARKAANADLVLQFARANEPCGTDLDGADNSEATRNKRLYEQCRLEAEEEAKQAAAATQKKWEDDIGITKMRQLDIAENERLTSVWNRPLDVLKRAHAGTDYRGAFDKYHTMVTVPKADVPPISAMQVIEAARDFIDIKRTEGTEYSEADIERISFYISTHAMALAFSDKKSECINPLSMDTWNHAAFRLEQLDAVHPKRTTAQPTAEPAHITENSDVAHDRAVVDEQFVGEVGEWIRAWSDSVEKNFGIVMTYEQKKRALDYIVDLNLPWNVHDSWNKARIHLAHIGVLVQSDGTLPLTEKEVILRTLDGLDLAVPSQRAEYLKLANYINYNNLE